MHKDRLKKTKKTLEKNLFYKMKKIWKTVHSLSELKIFVLYKKKLKAYFIFVKKGSCIDAEIDFGYTYDTQNEMGIAKIAFRIL